MSSTVTRSPIPPLVSQQPPQQPARNISKWFSIGLGAAALILYAVGGALVGAPCTPSQTHTNTHCTNMFAAGIALLALAGLCSVTWLLLLILYCTRRHKINNGSDVLWSPVAGPSGSWGGSRERVRRSRPRMEPRTASPLPVHGMPLDSRAVVNGVVVEKSIDVELGNSLAAQERGVELERPRTRRGGVCKHCGFAGQMVHCPRCGGRMFGA